MLEYKIYPVNITNRSFVFLPEKLQKMWTKLIIEQVISGTDKRDGITATNKNQEHASEIKSWKTFGLLGVK